MQELNATVVHREDVSPDLCVLRVRNDSAGKRVVWIIDHAATGWRKRTEPATISAACPALLQQFGK